MNRVWKTTKIILLSAVVLLAVAVGVVLGYRAYVQHANAKAIAIHSPNGIAEGMYVKIGGIDQWIQIGGEDRNNPALLCLHGGPGATWTPLTALFVPWEKQFTVVQWDQRGAGKTLEATGDSVADTMSINRMAQDGIEVAEFLRSHLHKDKVILLAHSWSSILGIRMVKERPDLFYAYVGKRQHTPQRRSARPREHFRQSNQAQIVARIWHVRYSHCAGCAFGCNFKQRIQWQPTWGQCGNALPGCVYC